MLRIFIGSLLIVTTMNLQATCPSKRDLLQKIRVQRQELTKQNAQLNILLQGNWNELNADSLFQTILEAKEEQALRIKELTGNLHVQPYRPKNLKLSFDCLDKYGIDDVALDLSNQARELDHARLVFLRLPIEIQELLLDPNRQVGPAYDDVRQLQDRFAILGEQQPNLVAQEEILLQEMLKRAQADLLATSQLKQLSATFKNHHATAQTFQEANSLWRQLVDDTFNTLRAPTLDFPLDHTFYEREDEIKKEADQWLQQGIERHYLLLVEAGRLRSDLAHLDGKRRWKLFDWQDIKREIKIVPYRFTGIFYSKMVNLRQKVRMGFAGIGPLARDAFIFILLLLIPFGLKRVFDNFVGWLDGIRTSILRTRDPSSLWKATAIWIRRLRPFLPWFFWYGALSLGEQLLAGTVLKELSLLFPYFKYFVLYRIFRRAVVLFLTGLSGHGGLILSREIKLKAAKTAKHVGLFALISFTLLHAVESVVSRGLVYELLVYFIQICTAFLILVCAIGWCDETAATTRSNLSGKVLELFDRTISHIPKFIKAIPLLFSAFISEVIAFIRALGADFDLSKRLSAQVFRRQLESAEELNDGEDNDGRLPKSYREFFPRGVPTDSNILIEPDGGALEKIENEITEWKKGKSDEHSLALYGDKGSGKSTILAQIAEHHKDIRVVAAEIPAKLLTRADVLKFFGHLFQADLSDGGRALMEADKEFKPTLVLLDEAQNLFLSRVGGFEGYKTLLELIGARTENIFWAASFNRYSWAFLNAVFGRNQHFRCVLKVQSWRDDDIKNLIMTRHKRGDWRLSFDAILQAVGSSRVDDAAAAIEAKFFKLLWEQSGGNPRAAQDLWLSSLSRLRGKTLRVGIPEDSGLKILQEVSDDGLFTYAALVRHENLSTHETTEVTDLPEGTVRYSLRLGLDNEFLERSEDGRYRVVADAQRSLILHLRKRNFIYGG